MRHRRIVVVGIAVAAAIALSGCSAAPTPILPEPRPSASPTATTEPAVEVLPVATTLVVGSTSVAVLDEHGDVLETLPYAAEGAVGVSFFERLFQAAPVVTQLVTGFGNSVGETVDAFVAAQPGVDTVTIPVDGVDYTQVHYDVGGGTPAPAGEEIYAPDLYWGASALAKAGIVTTLSAPQLYYDFC